METTSSLASRVFAAWNVSLPINADNGRRRSSDAVGLRSFWAIVDELVDGDVVADRKPRAMV